MVGENPHRDFAHPERSRANDLAESDWMGPKVIIQRTAMPMLPVTVQFPEGR
jgi:hypothetical protein